MRYTIKYELKGYGYCDEYDSTEFKDDKDLENTVICNMNEEMSLTAISAAVSHVSDLFSILLTDGICCGKEYRELVGLDELDILKSKLSKRIIELDDMISKDDE